MNDLLDIMKRRPNTIVFESLATLVCIFIQFKGNVSLRIAFLCASKVLQSMHAKITDCKVELFNTELLRKLMSIH